MNVIPQMLLSSNTFPHVRFSEMRILKGKVVKVFAYYMASSTLSLIYRYLTYMFWCQKDNLYADWVSPESPTDIFKLTALGRWNFLITFVVNSWVSLLTIIIQ